MKCKNIKELIAGGYFDKELDNISMENIREHLSRCADCRQFEERLISAQHLMQRSGRLEPDESIWLGVKQKIRAQAETRPRPFALPFFIPRPALIASLAAAVLILVFASSNIMVPSNSRSAAPSEEEALFLELGNGPSQDEFDTQIEEYIL